MFAYRNSPHEDFVGRYFPIKSFVCEGGLVPPPHPQRAFAHRRILRVLVKIAFSCPVVGREGGLTGVKYFPINSTSREGGAPSQNGPRHASQRAILPWKPTPLGGFPLEAFCPGRGLSIKTVYGGTGAFWRGLPRDRRGGLGTPPLPNLGLRRGTPP
jgi:hypothetical protein